MPKGPRPCRKEVDDADRVSHTTVYGPTFTQALGRHSGTELTSLTPAERIALTMALLNRGLDLMDGFADIAGGVRAGSGSGSSRP